MSRTQALSGFVSAFLLCYMVAAFASIFKVEPLPITTETQNNLGIPGGEGFQLVMDITYSPSNPQVAYLGSDTSQVWKSVDGGQSWQPKNTGYTAIGSRSLYVHPRNENIVFSAGTLGATASRVGSHSPIQGIFRSSDGGESWEFKHRADFYRQESRGALFALDSRSLAQAQFTIYAGTFREGLLVSRDSGETWERTGANPGQIFGLLELPNQPGKLLIASARGLFRFDGSEMQPVGKGLPGFPLSIAASPANPGTVLAALGEKGVYKSDDDGANFDRLLSSVPLLGSINDVYISPVDGRVAMFSKSGKRPGPYMSNDGGMSWQAARSINSKGVTDGGGFFFSSPIAMHPNNAAIALTSSNGRARVLRTEDGGENWFYSSSGYMGARLRSAVFLSPTRFILNLTDHGPWLSEDNGKAFTAIKVPRKGSHSTSGGAVIDDVFIFAVGTWHDKHLLVSRDGGTSWDDTGLTGTFNIVHAHNRLAGTVYAGGYRSDDGGLTWQTLPHDIWAVDPRDNDVLYSMTSAPESTQAFVSRDAGSNWKAIGKPLPLTIDRVNQIAVDTHISGRLYAAVAGGLWIFNDGRWRERTARHGLAADAFGRTYVANVAAHPGIPGLLFAGRRSPFKGMGNGLFYSSDYGESWKKVPSSRLANTNVWSIEINPYSGVVYVGTAHGIVTVTVSSMELRDNPDNAQS